MSHSSNNRSGVRRTTSNVGHVRGEARSTARRGVHVRRLPRTPDPGPRTPDPGPYSAPIHNRIRHRIRIFEDGGSGRAAGRPYAHGRVHGMSDDCRELAELQLECKSSMSMDNVERVRSFFEDIYCANDYRQLQSMWIARGIACEPFAERGIITVPRVYASTSPPCWRRFRILPDRAGGYFRRGRVGRLPVPRDRHPSWGVSRIRSNWPVGPHRKDSESTGSSRGGSSNAGFSSIHLGCCNNLASSARIPRAEAIALRPGVYRPTRAVADLRVCPSLTTSLMRGGHGGPQLRTNRPYWLNPSWSGWPSTSSSTP